AALLGVMLAGYGLGWSRRAGGWWAPYAVVALTLIFGVKFGQEARDSSHMKSAYELAMERLAKSEPAAKPLTAEQKTRLAEIDRVYRGKFAEREIFLKKQLNEALAKGEADESDKIRQQLADEKARLDEECEAEKEQVRKGK
ncbi:MAG TPA: hypothetical protein PLF88_14205, partial [Opitutaceae bacterium]|nr:hypothetical protein [Opitutaceae bacterium]